MGKNSITRIDRYVVNKGDEAVNVDFSLKRTAERKYVADLVKHAYIEI